MKTTFIIVFTVSSFLLVIGVVLTLANLIKLGGVFLGLGAIIGLGNKVIEGLYEINNNKR